jgi:hypothetical protein
MQSAANFMRTFLGYNSATMSSRPRDPGSSPSIGLLGLGVAILLLAVAPAAAQDAPAPAPSPDPPPARRVVVGTITGTVQDPQKKPMVGCMVQLKSKGQDGVLRVTGTDEKGGYVFKDLPAGTYDIEVGTLQDLTRRKERIEVRPPFRNIVDFDMGLKVPAALLGEALKKQAADAPAPAASPEGPAAAVPVRGTFVDAQRRPIPEVSVMLLPLQGKETFQAFSAIDGTFSLPAVPPGRYRVLVSSPGYVSIDLKTVDVAPASGLNLSLSLVDYPLNFKGRAEDRPPAEEPLPVPPQNR